MRIISKFQDYYDSAQGQGQDRSLVFARQTEEFDLRSADASLEGDLREYAEYATRVAPGHLSLNKSSKEFAFTEVGFGLILFAGRLYPFARLWRRRVGVFGEVDTAFSYNWAELAELLAPHGYDLASRDKPRRSRHRWNLDGGKQSTEAFFELSGSEVFRAKSLEWQRPCLSCQNAGKLLQVNPRLADFQLYRKLDAWQAFQELSMFLGNIAAPDRTPVSVSDKDRIAQHGFDKWSFRKPPQHA